MTDLLIPISVEALIVQPKDEERFVRVDMRPPTPSQPSSDGFRSQPFEKPEALAPGAYLHWAVPDSLASGRFTSGKAEFPPLPDRWLVIRTWGTKERSAKGWVLPDSAAETAQVIPLPVDTLPGAGPGTITALGTGHESWSGYFANVENRFGFHDDLNGVDDPAGLSWLVVGWYADPKDDPLANRRSLAATLRALESLEWEIDPGSPLSLEVGPFPLRCVFHGAVLDAGGAGGPDLKPSKPRALIGENVAEMAAVALGMSRAEAALVAASAQGLLPILSTDGDEERFRVEVHANRFAAWQPTDAKATVVERLVRVRGEGQDRSAVEIIRRAPPRWWRPADPSILLSGAGRSHRHGGDGRFSHTAGLKCRLKGQVLAPAADMPLPVDGLLGFASNLRRSIRDLYRECYLLDPNTPNSPIDALARREWLKDAGKPPPGNLRGLPPSAVAFTPGRRPWTPMHVEWEIEYLPVPAAGWSLGDIDFEPTSKIEPTAPRQRFLGRSHLVDTPVSLLASALGRSAHGEGMPDLLAAPINDLERRRKGVDGQDRSVVTTNPGLPRVPDKLAASPKDLVRAGYVRLTRLRIVDGFGRFVDVKGDDVGAVPPTATLVEGGWLPLQPRFTEPAQVGLRFMDARDTAAMASPDRSPACGYIVASDSEDSIEFFETDGQGRGQLLCRNGRTQWDERFGQVETLGRRPSDDLANPILGKVADALLRADADRPPKTRSVVEALAGICDLTYRMTEDFGQEEYLAMLFGKPIALVAADIEVRTRSELPKTVAIEVPLRLGSPGLRQDGLLGFFVGDRFDRLFLTDEVAALAGAAGPLPPFFRPQGELSIAVGRRVPLTLLMVPMTAVSVTTGMLPQKSVALAREWTERGIAAMLPGLSFGPLLRAPEAMRLPLPQDPRFVWHWHHRDKPDQWKTEEVVPVASGGASVPKTVWADDGWLTATRREAPARQLPRLFLDQMVLLSDKLRVLDPRGGPSVTVPSERVIDWIESGQLEVVTSSGSSVEVISENGKKRLRERRG